jgi:YesN/AraC family two-component response regulator
MVAAPCETASDGREVMEIIARKDIDIVISDIVMPEIDGLTL